MLRQQFAERRGHLLFHTEVQLAFALTVTEGAVSVRKSDPKRTVSEPAEAIHRGAASAARSGYPDRPKPEPKHRLESSTRPAWRRVDREHFHGNKDEKQCRNSLSAVCQNPAPARSHGCSTRQRGVMKIKAGFLPRSDSHRKIQSHTKASRRAQIQPREIPQSGVNSRIPEFESRCTGVPKCRPSEK